MAVFQSKLLAMKSLEEVQKNLLAVAGPVKALSSLSEGQQSVGESAKMSASLSEVLRSIGDESGKKAQLSDMKRDQAESLPGDAPLSDLQATWASGSIETAPLVSGLVDKLSDRIDKGQWGSKVLEKQKLADSSDAVSAPSTPPPTAESARDPSLTIGALDAAIARIRQLQPTVPSVSAIQSRLVASHGAVSSTAARGRTLKGPCSCAVDPTCCDETPSSGKPFPDPSLRGVPSLSEAVRALPAPGRRKEIAGAQARPKLTPTAEGRPLGASIAPLPGSAPLHKRREDHDRKRDRDGDACGEGDMVVRGKYTKELAAAVDHVKQYMVNREIPNGTFAVIDRDGRLVCCIGLTNCKVLADNRQPIQIADPHSRFRTASLTKIITTVGVLAAVQDGVFGPAGLDAYAADYVEFRHGDDDPIVLVPELWNIKLRHLLTHSAGWVELKMPYPRIATCNPFDNPLVKKSVTVPEVPSSGSPGCSPGFMFEKNDFWIAEELHIRTPIDRDDIRSIQNRTRLTWDPARSTHWSYSNHGFNVAGEVLGRAVHDHYRRMDYDYESYVKARVCGRLGMTDTTLGHTERHRQAPREMNYYSYGFPGQPPARTSGKYVANVMRVQGSPEEYSPYGYFNMRNSPGWITSGYDLALLMRDVFHRRGSVHVLDDATNALMLTPQIRKDPDPRNGQCFGWESDSEIRLKGGHMNGVQAFMFNFGPDGTTERDVSFVYMFNRQEDERSDAAPSEVTATRRHEGVFKDRLIAILDATVWPGSDSFWGQV